MNFIQITRADCPCVFEMHDTILSINA